MSGNDISWLLDNFVQETPGVRHAQTVSSDGMHLAGSSEMTSTQTDTFAAITAGLASLSESAGDLFQMRPIVRQVIETGDGWFMVTRVSSRASLAVITAKGADLGLVGFEMTLLAEKAGEVLSPEVIESLKSQLAV